MAHVKCELCRRGVSEPVSDPRSAEAPFNGRGKLLHRQCMIALGLAPAETACSLLEVAAASTGIVRGVQVILMVEKRHRKGCIDLHFCRRGMGPLVGIYDSVKQGIESDPATPWSVLCEEHSTVVCCETLTLARSTSADTRNFCDDCRETRDLKGGVDVCA